MSLAISSAIPNDLARYSSVGSRLNAELALESNKLANILQHFEATCRESGYALRVSHLADELRRYAQETDPLDRWVGVVGVGFFIADSASRIVTWAEWAVGGVLVISVARSSRYLTISLDWVKVFGLTPSGARTFLGITGTRIRVENLLKQWDKAIGNAAVILLIALKWAEDFRDYTGTELISALLVDAAIAIIVVKIATVAGGVVLTALAGGSLPAIVVGALAVGVAVAVGKILDGVSENLRIRDWTINAVDTIINWTIDRVTELLQLSTVAVVALDEKVFMPISRSIAAGVDNLTDFVDSAAKRLQKKLRDAVDAADRVLFDKAIRPTSGEALELRNRLHDAMDGWGTDEDAIFALLAKASSTEIQAVLNDKALMERLNRELSSKDMEYIRHTALAGQPTFPRDDFGRGIRYDEIHAGLFNSGSDGRDIHPNDIKQGALGDCYLMAALAELAHVHPELIGNIVAANEEGRYRVIFYDEALSRYVEVMVDNRFPVRRSGLPSYAQMPDEKELWPMVIEKAYAEYFGEGGYDRIEGGYPGLAMQRLTGLHFTDYKQSNIDDLTLERMGSQYSAGQPICVGTAEVDPRLLDQRGLIADHAYYVTSVDVDTGTITVRNPHGWEYSEISLTWEDFRSLFSLISTLDAPPRMPN